MKTHKRKLFFVLLASLMTAAMILPSAEQNGGTLTEAKLPAGALWNGIVIPANHTFGIDANKGDPVTVPYLLSAAQGGYAPELVNIDRGRQLFVDDFLISETTLNRRFYSALLHEENPVFYPETTWEKTATPSTACTSGGIWYDMDAKVYKMWYESGFNNRLAYATSEDGIHWTRPEINADGTNLLVRQQQTDSFSVWIDYNADPSERYKLMIRSPNNVAKEQYDNAAILYTSANGINWQKRGTTGSMGDRSTFFYNPFTNKWVFSIRATRTVKWGSTSYRPRLRLYHAGSDFLTAGAWETNDPVLWLKPDSADQIDRSVSDEIPGIYNFDSVAYESLMLGFFQMWYGPENDEIAKTGLPKITEIQLGYSRDGFYYDRPDRNAIIPASRTEGTWDYGYLQTCTGGVIVYDDEIRIYYSAFSGQSEVDGVTVKGSYVGGAVGYASLRRDGFASMNGSGTLTTKPLTVTKDVKYLFVNTNSAGGSLRAEILDANGNVLEGYSAADCDPISENTTKAFFTWKDGKTLEQLKGKAFRIRFVSESASLYSFWLSADEEGASGGEMAAGYVSSEETPDQPQPETDSAESDTAPTSGEPATAEPAPAARGCKSVFSGAALTVPVSVAGAALLKKKRKNYREAK